jgi:hypothetical protein
MGLMARKLRRVQIDMSEKAFARLEWLKEATDASSFTDVIRDALETREAVVKIAQEGKNIFTEDPETKERGLLIMR